MALREILIFPHKSLREKAKPVVEVDDDLRALLDDMAETMWEAPGIGLAGPQIGVSERILVVDITPMLAEEEVSPGLMKVINPEILEQSGTNVFEEGCLSLPGLLEEIERSAEIRLAYTDENGERKELAVEGILATVLQHEIDHLDGVLILDYMSPLKRSRYKSKLKKELKRIQQEGSSRDND